MQIGIIGSGNVAQTLGSGFLQHGYQVMLGTRNADQLKEWHAENPTGKVGSVQEAATFGTHAVVLAVKGEAAVAAVESASTQLAGKTVLDACNPIDEKTGKVGPVLTYFTGPNDSLMERLQTKFPSINFVKAFNAVGASVMINPVFKNSPGDKPSMPICGNSEVAKKVASGIIEKFGFIPEDYGPVQAARPIEALAILWCIKGFKDGLWFHAFKMLK